VGSRLAACLQMRFVDTDDLIEERYGSPISDIVKSRGWDYFRAAEKKTIKEITDQDHTIIAAGGGAILDVENVEALRRKGLIIWLKADRDVLLRRMDQDPQTIGRRPSLTGKGNREELDELLAYRQPFYERASEIQIDTSTLDVEAVVERIVTIFDNLNL
jgi:shikimate kinase